MFLFEGFSRQDSIRFSTLNFSVNAIQKPNGKIEIVNEDIDSGKEKKISKWVLLRRFFSEFCIWILPAIIKVNCIIPKISESLKSLYLLPALFYLVYLIYAVIHLLIQKNSLSIRKNHAAEHQAIQAYNRLGKIPSVNEVKKFSRIYRGCGISRYSSFITAQIIGFIFFFFYDFIIPEWIIILASFLFSHVFPFYLLGAIVQFLTTSPADDGNINLAISAIKELERLENNKKRII